jgi:hypothetical protein
MSTWTGRLPVRPLMCTSQGESGPPGQRNAWGWRSTPGGAWDKRAHAAAALGSVPPGGSQRSASTAVPATLLLARITSIVAAGAVAGRFAPAPQPVTVSAAAITAMTATVGLAFMLSKTAAQHRKFPVSLGRVQSIPLDLAHAPERYPSPPVDLGHPRVHVVQRRIAAAPLPR